jgi:hypothetical protein
VQFQQLTALIVVCCLTMAFAAAGAHYLDGRMPKFEKEAPIDFVDQSSNKLTRLVIFVKLSASKFSRTCPHFTLVSTLPFHASWGLTRLQRVLCFTTVNFAAFGCNALFVTDSVVRVCVNGDCDQPALSHFLYPAIVGVFHTKQLQLLGLIFFKSAPRKSKICQLDADADIALADMQDAGLSADETANLQTAVVKLFEVYDTRRDGLLGSCEMSAVYEDFATHQYELKMKKASMKEKLLHALRMHWTVRSWRGAPHAYSLQQCSGSCRPDGLAWQLRAGARLMQHYHWLCLRFCGQFSCLQSSRCQRLRSFSAFLLTKLPGQQKFGFCTSFLSVIVCCACSFSLRHAFPSTHCGRKLSLIQG